MLWLHLTDEFLKIFIATTVMDNLLFHLDWIQFMYEIRPPLGRLHSKAGIISLSSFGDIFRVFLI